MRARDGTPGFPGRLAEGRKCVWFSLGLVLTSLSSVLRDLSPFSQQAEKGHEVNDCSLSHSFDDRESRCEI